MNSNTICQLNHSSNIYKVRQNAFAQHVTIAECRLAAKQIISMTLKIFSYFCASFNRLQIIFERRFLTLIIISTSCFVLSNCSE